MRRSGLFLKYLIPLVLLSAGGLLANSLIELYFSYQENKTALGRVQQEKAANAAIRIEQFVREIEHQLVWIAQTPWESAGASLDHRRLDSLRLLRHVPTVTEVSHLDPSGHEQLRVSRLAMDVMGSNIDYSNDPRFKLPANQKTYFSSVYFRKESEPYMTIALGGRSEGAGVVVAEANLKFIWDVVSRMEVGTGGYAYVLDDQGHLIAHPDISLVLQKTDFSVLPQVRSARANSAENPRAEAITGRDLKNGDVLSAHASIEPLGWKVFVDRPIKEAFAPLYSSALRTGALLIAGLLISVIASLVLVRRMVTPIRALQAGAAKIGAGELGHRIQVNTGDELEALGTDFNNMTAQLQESYAGLERKVDERTSDLREALEQQTATFNLYLKQSP
jgi:HAMP domain-containing protein